MILTDVKYYRVIKVLKRTFDNRYVVRQSTDTFLQVADTITEIESVCMKDSELFEGITNGKIAVFPRYVRQDMELVKKYSDMGFDCYLMNYRDYQDFKKRYIEKCIEGNENITDCKQLTFNFE